MHRVALVLLWFLLACLGACGEDKAPSATPPADEDPAGMWSAPDGAPGAPPDAGRDLSGTTTAKGMLDRLRAQVAAGQALSGAAWQQDLESLADLLWPPTNEEGVPAPITAHMRLLQVAGDVGRALVRDPEERQRWESRHPEDVKIYEDFLTISARGPEVYRAWVTADGGALLAAKAARLQKMFEQR